MLRKLFDHAVYTEDPLDLGLIRSSPEINLVAAKMRVQSDVRDYLDALDIERDFKSLEYDQAINPQTGDTIIRPYKTLFSLHYNAAMPPTTQRVIEENLVVNPHFGVHV